MAAKGIGEAATAEERRLEAALAAFGWSGRKPRYALAVPGVISPLHRGVANACYRVDLDDGTAAFVKVPQDDILPTLRPTVALDAAAKAGALGVTPPLLAADPASGAGAFALLDETWRYAKVDDLTAPGRLETIVGMKRRLHAGPAFLAEAEPFGRIAALEDALRPLDAPLPPDWTWLRANLAEIRAALTAAGWDSRPCHLDAPASNVMVGPGDALLLVDFDSAGNADPWYDLGALLTEATQFDEDFRRGVEIFWGSAPDPLVHRAQLWGIVDDLAWGLWATWCFATSPRSGVEFFKYASWRFMRARMNVGDWRFETRLRRL